MELVELKISDKENSVKYALMVNGKNVGSGYIFSRETNPIEIYIEENFRSNGYGKYLFNSLVKILKDRGVKGAIFESNKDNLRFINIIKQAGAKEISRQMPKVRFVIKF